MVNNAITKHIVTQGDYAMVPAGQRLFDCPNCREGKDAKIFYNVAPGQLVAYTISATTLQPVTVDNTNLSTIAHQDLYIGVGIDEDGDGAADNVRLLAGEKIDNCLLDEVSVSAPVCGQPQVLGAYLDCVECWEQYAIQFKYTDNQTRSFGLTREDAEVITGSIQPDCSSCADCEPEANCQEVACKLVDLLNNEMTYGSIGHTYPDAFKYPDKKADFRPKPYRAVVLHPNWHVFCINPTAATCDCEGCTVTNSIIEATINDDTIVFSGNLNPSNNAQTYLAQLWNIAQQIECGFEDQYGPHAGFAFVSGGGPDKCCPYQLHVVTCDNNFELIGGSGPIQPCDAINPFPTFSEDVSCVDCTGTPAGTYTPTCGVGVIIEQPTIDCDCFVQKPLGWYSRTGELTFVKDLDSYSPIVKAAELLAPRFPENFGAWIQWLEYSQESGGKGNTWRDVNARQGWMGLPDSPSRARNAVQFAQCHKSYCTYYLGHSMHRRPSLTKSPAFNRLQSFVHIPSDDTNTLDSWETFFNELLNVGATTCQILGPVSCLQVEGTPTYAPVNTGIPVGSPAYTPSYEPNYTPIPYSPTYAPNYVPTYTTPTYTPIYAPTYTPNYTPI